MLALSGSVNAASTAADIVGSWYLYGNVPGSVAGTSQAVAFTFTSDGNYYQVEDQSTASDPNGHSGMEYGAYTWNPATGAFTHTTVFDTNGEWGFSHSICREARVSGDTLTVTCADTSRPTVFGTSTFTRVVNPNNPIVGSWHLVTGGGGDRIFTFLSDGAYLSAGNENPAFDPSGQKGMERGTYTWNASSGAFTHITTVNTDGQWGLSHSICNNALVSGNTLTLNCADTARPTAFNSFSVTRVAAVASGTTIPPNPSQPVAPPPATQSAYTVTTGQMPTAAVTTTATGTLGSATLTVTLDLSKVLAGGSFASLGQFAAGYNIYVLALVPSGALGLPNATWFMYPATRAWAALGSPIAAFMEGLAQNATHSVIIPILQGMDVTSLLGTEFYIGYGTSDTEMLSASRYRGVYKVQ